MEKEKIGRLALRVEGMWWVAYYATPDTLEGAVKLATIHMAAVKKEARKRAFLELMQQAVADTIEEAAGARPSWSAPQDAPERERSGDG